MKIIGVSLRYFKCYEATELIPLYFDDEKFVGFIGENGAGKSAVLEALHAFFTNQNWIRNKTGKKGEAICGVAPILICKEVDLVKKFFSLDDIRKIKKYSREIEKNLTKKISLIKNKDTLYLSCILFQNGETSLFDGGQKISEEDELAEKIKQFIHASFKYIYIGAEVDIDDSTDINSKMIEFIKGSGVVGEVKDILKKVKLPKNESIANLINDRVIAYLEDEVIKKLQMVDKDYDYKNLRTGAISKLSEKHISELAVQAIFNNRKLTKKIKAKDIDISDMSSGQRRKSLLDFILVMIGNLSQKEREKIILAIDEPEISVDASSRIQQFDKLRELTKIGPNVIFTTHWYGWIAQLKSGNAVLIKETDQGRGIISSSIERFLEKDIKDKVPYEMRMMFDFLSSLGTWAESDTEKKFIICEGITDHNFIIKHYPEFKVIPLRGIDEVIRLYKIFSDYYFRVSKKPSNIVFLIDTDPGKSAEFKNVKGDNLKRISRDSSSQVKIVNNSDNYSERCSIEDILSPNPLLVALKKSVDILTVQQDVDFINSLSVVYEDQTGVRAFSLDDVKKARFNKIYKSDFKKKVSEMYLPTNEDMIVFKELLNLF
jgi:ABC-type Mn2+/Zn2+ transport system ATPase subunit